MGNFNDEGRWIYNDPKVHYISSPHLRIFVAHLPYFKKQSCFVMQQCVVHLSAIAAVTENLDSKNKGLEIEGSDGEVGKSAFLS